MPFRYITESEIRQAWNANEVRKMEESRYDGRCAVCGNEIAAYTVPIYYLFAESVKQIVHEDCFKSALEGQTRPDEKAPGASRTNPYRKNTKRGIITDLILQGKNRREIYDELRPMITGQVKPMIYTANVEGTRQPKSISEQYRELWTDIARKITDAGKLELLESETPEEIGDEETGEEKPKKAIQKSLSWPDPEWIKSEIDFLDSEVKRLRRFFRERGQFGGQEVEEISMRPVVNGRNMIRAGIPAKGCLYALTMHLSPETRQAAGVEDFDQLEFSRSLDNCGEGTHEMLPYVLRLAKAGVPIYLVGPKGSGKSTLARQLADALALEYGECPMTSGATPTWLLGRYVDRYVPSDFMNRYSDDNGGSAGVFCFEEIDSADANMLLVTNNALASDSFHNPISGTTVSKSGNFVPTATANTMGDGATGGYGARERLDSATIDRWAMGRVFVDIDESLETFIAHESYEPIV